MNANNNDFKEEVPVEGNVDIGNVVNGEMEQEHSEVDALEKELQKSQQQTQEFKKQYLRALADYQNLEKRIKDERAEIMKIAQANVISRLFPVLDNLRQAEIFVKDPGLKLVQDSFMNVLRELGLKEIELLGKEYDPHVAEVVDVVQGEEDNMIVEVVTKGYEYNGKVMRPGQVRVSKKL